MSRNARIVMPLAFLGFIAFTVYNTIDLRKNTCEVCVEFEGREACATASGSSREESVKTATDTACGKLTSGMEAQFRCTQ